MLKFPMYMIIHVCFYVEGFNLTKSADHLYATMHTLTSKLYVCM